MKIDTTLEFDKVKEKWLALALTDSAREQIAGITYFLDERELRKQLKDTTDARKFMELCGAPPLVSVEEPKEILALAEKESCLTPYQLERMEVFDTVQNRKIRHEMDRKYTEETITYERGSFTSKH